MKTIRVVQVLLALVLGSASLSACAADCSPQVRDGWVRIPPAGLPMAAGFATFDNHCDAAATIVGASSQAFAETTVHATRVEDGISRMRAVPELRVAPNSIATFAPGGLHLMLMHPTRTLKAGEQVQVEFVLEDGRKIHSEFVVKTL